MRITISDIKRVIAEIKYQSNDDEQIEGLGLNSDDLAKLTEEIESRNIGAETEKPDTQSHVYLCGMRVFHSKFFPKGEIWKIGKPGIRLFGGSGFVSWPRIKLNKGA